MKKTSEIGGMGLARKSGNSDVEVYDIWPIYADENSTAHLSLDKNAVNADMARVFSLEYPPALQDGTGVLVRNPESSAFSDYRVNWHSHPDGTKEFSSIDETYIEKTYPSEIKPDWMVALLVVDGEVYGRQQIYDPFFMYLDLKKVEVKKEEAEKCSHCEEKAAIRKKEDEVIFAEMVKDVDLILPERPKPVWPGHGHKSLWDEEMEMYGDHYGVKNWDKRLQGNGHQSWRWDNVKKEYVPVDRLKYIKFSDFIWNDFCDMDLCTNETRYAMQSGNQFCHKCIKRVSTGSVVVFDRARKDAAGAPNEHLLKKYGLKQGWLIKERPKEEDDESTNYPGI